MALHMRIGKLSLQRGFTYMGVLMVMVISGIAMAGAGLVWHQQTQRVKEQELMFVGEAIRQAIRSYYQPDPNGLQQYPPSLEALLLDDRYPVIKRHLRQLYLDPITRSADWGLIKQQDRIIGLYSLSRQKPLKQTDFPSKYENFSGAKSYQQWQFVYVPGQE
jgi:type II secretory pathway pseudopilin PulG